MTSIKPPSSGPIGPHTPADRSDTSSSVSHGSQQTDGAASSSFQRSLEQAREAHQVSPTSGSTGTSGADRITQLADSVESGSLSLDQAVDELLGQTLARAERHLSPEQRAELSDLLRNALASDPTLSSLRGERP